MLYLPLLISVYSKAERGGDVYSYSRICRRGDNFTAHIGDYKMKKLASIALLLLVIIALTASTAMARCYSETSNDFDEFSASVPNPCNEDEEIHLTGTFHWLLHLTSCDNGSFRAVLHRDIQNLVGIGDDGERYVSAEVWNSHYFVKEGEELPFQEAATVIIVLVGQESGLVMKILSTLHITINANHEIEISDFDMDIICGP